MTDALRTYLTRKLAVERPLVDRMNTLYDAQAPLAYIAPEVRRVFGDRITPLNINLARVAADSIAQRLQVSGFRSALGDPVDDDVTTYWRTLDLPTAAALAQLEALVSGRAFFAVSEVDGRVVVTAESPTQVTVTRDPITRRIVGALKRYRAEDGLTRSVVMTPDTIDTYVSRSDASALDPTYTYSPNVMGEDAVLESSVPNLLGVVPIVALVNRPRLAAPDGQSDLADLEAPLTAISKLGSDMLTASEAAAMPRRWTSIPGDVSEEQAKTISDTVNRTLTAPGGTKTLVISGGGELHEFSTADLENFDRAIRLLIASVGSLASLPTHYVNGDTSAPTSADAIRASESRLTAKTLERQRWWGPAYADLMRLALLARDGQVDPRLADLTTLWVDPAPASVGMEADAAVKLVAAGVWDRRAALEQLDTDPLEIERILASTTGTPAPRAVDRVIRDGEGNLVGIERGTEL